MAGVCVPNECSRIELTRSINRLVKSTFNVPIRVDFECPRSREFVDEDDWLSRGSFIKKSALVMVAAMIAAVLCSTVVDVAITSVKTNRNKLLNRMHLFAKNFSIVETNRRLFRRTLPGEKGSELSFLHGVRMAYFWLTLFGHIAVTVGAYGPVTLIHTATKVIDEPWWMRYFSFKISPIYMVINFVMGGLLASYSWHEMFVKNRCRVSFATFALIRFVRPLAVIIFTVAVVLAMPLQLGSGPMFEKTLNNITGNCVTRGWWELAGISDFLPVKYQVSCGLHSQA